MKKKNRGSEIRNTFLLNQDHLYKSVIEFKKKSVYIFQHQHDALGPSDLFNLVKTVVGKI